MFVRKSTHEREVARLRGEIRDLTEVLEHVEPKALRRAKRAAEEYRGESITLASYPLEFEETPVDKTAPDKKPLPPRSEYDERLAKAIELFAKRKNRTYVEKALDISRTTARNYLRIAVRKRKVKKSEYDELNT